MLSAIALGMFLGGVPAYKSLVPIGVDRGFDKRTLDFADLDSRRTLLEHERFLRSWGLDSLQCHQGRESYRLFNEPGLMGGDMVIVEAQIEGLRGSLDVREFGPLPVAMEGRSYGWNPLSSRQVPASRFDIISSQLTDILQADARPRINDRFVDAPRVTIETCRNQRYHFFVRNSDTYFDEDDGTKIVRLAQSLLHLAKRDQPSTAMN